MTTNTQSQTSEKTLNELITAKTYQGLTDEEIDIIIDYRIKQAIANAEIDAKISEMKRANDLRTEELRQSSAKAVSMLESMLNRNLVLRTVEVCNE